MDFFTLQDYLGELAHTALADDPTNPPSHVFLYVYYNSYFVAVTTSDGFSSWQHVNQYPMPEDEAQQWYDDLSSGKKTFTDFALSVPGYD